MRNLLLVSAVVLCLAAAASAQLPDVAIALHIANSQLYTLDNCNLTTEWPAATGGEILYFHVVICGHMYNAPQNNGFTGVEYDVAVSSGGLVLSWDPYDDYPIGSPGEGIIGLWQTCQNELHPYIIGVLSVEVFTPPVYVDIITYPITQMAQLSDCDFLLWPVLPSPPGNGRAGQAVAGGTGGHNPCPCQGAPVEMDSWSTIKSMYR